MGALKITGACTNSRQVFGNHSEKLSFAWSKRMKEPWEVFLESFRYDAPSLDPDAPLHDTRERGNEILKGGQKAGESLLYHLVRAERWKVAEAKALAWEFNEATVDWMNKKDKNPSTRTEDAVKNQWTDWVLQHR